MAMAKKIKEIYNNIQKTRNFFSVTCENIYNKMPSFYKITSEYRSNKTPILNHISYKNLKIALGVLVYSMQLASKDVFWKRFSNFRFALNIAKSMQYSKQFSSNPSHRLKWHERVIAMARFAVDLYINVSLTHGSFYICSILSIPAPAYSLAIAAIFLHVEFLEKVITDYMLNRDDEIKDHDIYETVAVFYYAREFTRFCREYIAEILTHKFVENHTYEGKTPIYIFLGFVLFYANIAIKEILMVVSCLCQIVLGGLHQVPGFKQAIDFCDAVTTRVLSWFFSSNFTHIYIDPKENQASPSSDYKKSDQASSPKAYSTTSLAFEDMLDQCSNIASKLLPTLPL